MELLEKMRDLLVQATTEKSHYYVASTLREAIDEIQKLRKLNKTLGELVIDLSK